MLRQQIFRRKGKLVVISPFQPEATEDDVACHLEPILQAAAGGFLEAYRS